MKAARRPAAPAAANAAAMRSAPLNPVPGDRLHGRACAGGARDRAGRGSRAKPIAVLLASPMTRGTAAEGGGRDGIRASSACAGLWSRSQVLQDLGEVLVPA